MKPIQNGQLLSAIQVSPVKAQAVTTLGQIKAYGLHRPTEVDKRPTKSDSQEAISAHEIHEQTQRNFDKARKNRAVDYASYIKSVEMDNAMGGTPPITIYFPKALEETDGGLIIPYGAVLTAIDGETQTEARYLLAEAQPETMNNPIAVTVYHGISLNHAKQILHDVNHYVTPVSEVKASSFNHNGAISKATAKALKQSGLDASNVNMKGATSNKKTCLAHVQIMDFIAGCQLSTDVARKGISASIMSKLNSPLGDEIGQHCVDSTAEVIRMAVTNSLMGKYNKSLWQIAGVLCSTGRSVRDLNWVRANNKYEELKTSGRGGVRLSMAKKLEAIEQSF